MPTVHVSKEPATRELQPPKYSWTAYFIVVHPVYFQRYGWKRVLR